MDRSSVDWPFFDEVHRELAAGLEAWCSERRERLEREPADIDAACRSLVGELADGGWLGWSVPGDYGGRCDGLEVRSLCLIREILARHSGLADFAFAMQGLGAGPISLYGRPDQCQRYLPDVCGGRRIAAFALSEPDAGSDVAALAMRARREGGHYVLDGRKTWISNGGIADFYTVFARTGEAPGAKGLSAFVVDAETPGLQIEQRIDVIAPHPLATLGFDGCRIPAEQLIGAPGQGFAIAMATLDVFRASVGAAALGFARRALAEATARSLERRIGDVALADLQLTQARLADMAVDVDASALLVYRAAWTRDVERRRISRESAMAKLHATESAQRVIDAAVQLHGGLGVVRGQPVERLYREIRALRIYEGTSEIQKLVIARELLREYR